MVVAIERGADRKKGDNIMYWAFQRDPWVEMGRIQRLLGADREESAWLPAVNVWSGEDTVVLTADVPGVDPKDVSIDVQGRLLTISGERKAEEQPDDMACWRGEKGSGKFSRSFRLPFEVDSAKVTAKYHNGVLKITLPQTEASKPKKITVTSG
jgi:HSP20 family protein